MVEHVPIVVMRDDRRDGYRGCSQGGSHRWKQGFAYWFCQACGIVDADVVVGARKRPVPRPEPGPSRMPANPDLIRQLWERDGKGCFYCGQLGTPDQFVRDHFIPASKGGPDAIENRRAACRECDRAKGPRMPDDFMALLAKRAGDNPVV